MTLFRVLIVEQSRNSPTIYLTVRARSVGDNRLSIKPFEIMPYDNTTEMSTCFACYPTVTRLNLCLIFLACPAMALSCVTLYDLLRKNPRCPNPHTNRKRIFGSLLSSSPSGMVVGVFTGSRQRRVSQYRSFAKLRTTNDHLQTVTHEVSCFR
jgi:hypothetical protein